MPSFAGKSRNGLCGNGWKYRQGGGGYLGDISVWMSVPELLSLG